MIAEILSRYYPQEIQMHSFDNGCNIATKQDNWTQLQKFFNKIEFEFTETDMDNIIQCTPDSARIIVTKIYELTTNKK